MAAAEEEVQACESCGASIYPEHLREHSAGNWNGKLLCPFCLKEQQQVSDAEAVPAPAPGPPAEVEEAPIALVAEDEIDQATDRPASIRAFASGVQTGSTAFREQYRRGLLSGSANATRCRTFHTKLNDASFAHMNQQINEWVDSNEDIEIKFATSVIGVVEGKHADPHLIVTVFY